MTKQLSDDINIILDCFGGGDGGISFVKLKQALTIFDRKATGGDKSADQIITMVHRFAKLIKLTSDERFWNKG